MLMVVIFSLILLLISLRDLVLVTSSTLHRERHSSIFGGVAGTTTIRNSLIVNGDTDMMGDVTMNGGSNSGTNIVTRASLNTSKIAHSAGSLSNLNVDLEFIADIDGAEITSVNGSNGQMVVADNYFLMVTILHSGFSDGLTGLSNNINTTTTYFVVNSSAANGTLRLLLRVALIVFSGTPGTSTGITLQNTLVDTGSGTNLWTGNSSGC